MKEIKRLIPYAVIILVVVFIRTYIVAPVRVTGPSMENSLHNGDVLLLEKFNNSYERFDIVVVNYGDEKIIKRIIGLPGETVKYVANKLYVNGELIEEPFITDATEDFSLENIGYDTIPAGYYFLVGDNRDNSLDSRFIGLFKESAIDGKVELRIFPFNSVGKLNY